MSDLDAKPGQVIGPAAPGEPVVIRRPGGSFPVPRPNGATVKLYCEHPSSHKRDLDPPLPTMAVMWGAESIEAAYPLQSPCEGHVQDPDPLDLDAPTWRFCIKVDLKDGTVLATDYFTVTNGTGDDGWPPMRP